VDPRIGTEFAGHRIEQIIGRGGVSVVYLAEHLRLGRKVALKVLAPHLADDEAFRERFIRESRIAAGLDHPNIVTIYDAGEIEDSLYISMRFVEGSDLARLLREEGPLETSRMILLLSHVASALDTAHMQGLVHRDVKPANVLVETVDGFERAYLSDFGISKRTTTGSGLTRTGQFVGTVDFVAPEQISGQPIDGRTDVYSLGCVLFLCVAGRVPFPGDTEVATIYRQLHDPPPSLEGYVDAAEEVDAVIGKALAKAKEDRYATCSSLIEAARVSLSGAEEPSPVAGEVLSDDIAPERGQAVTQVLEAPPRRGVRQRALWMALAGGTLAVALVAAILLANVDEGPGPRDTGPEATAGVDPPTTSPPPPSERLQLTWVPLKEPLPRPEDQVMSDVVAGPDGLVAVGHVQAAPFDDDAAVWFSGDVDRWRASSSESLTGPEDQRLLGVTDFDGRLIAGGWEGTDAAAWSSTDSGETWTRTATGLGPGLIRDFAILGSTVVAVGAAGNDPFDQDAAVWTSADGLRWTPVLDEDLQGEGGQHVWAVHAAGGRLIAVGFEYATDGSYDGAVWTSPDGLDWSRADPAMFEEAGHQVIKAIVGGTRGLPLVAVGCEDDTQRCDIAGQDSNAAVWTSDDGERWIMVELEGEWLVGPGVQTMYGISRQGDTFIAVGAHTAETGDLDGAVWTSTDGGSWVFQHRPSFKVRELGGPPDDQTIRALTPFHGKDLSFVAVGVTDDGSDQDEVVWGGS
jgi:predicted Ser/Thr protein kinase